MVVRDLNVKGIGIDPAEADAPLVVDSNTVLSQPVPQQGLQAIARNRSQIRQGRRSMDMVEFPFRHRSNALKLPAELAADHSPIVLPLCV
jgi:hypothetical protein